MSGGCWFESSEGTNKGSPTWKRKPHWRGGRSRKPRVPQGLAGSNSCRFRHTRTVGREVRHRHAKPANPQGCGGSIPPPSAIRASSPIGRRRHLEVVNSAGSNPAVRTHAIVAQLVGGAALKTRTVRVRIPPMAPRWRSPTAEAASLKLVQVSVQIGPPARVPPLSRL